MLLDAIATVMLAGLMLVPLLNVIVGGVGGAGLAGPVGGIIGILLAIAITALERWLVDCLGAHDSHQSSSDTQETIGRGAGGDAGADHQDRTAVAATPALSRAGAESRAPPRPRQEAAARRRRLKVPSLERNFLAGSDASPRRSR